MNLRPEAQPYFCIVGNIKGNKGVRECKSSTTNLIKLKAWENFKYYKLGYKILS